MSTNQETPKIPLPKGWKQPVRAAVLHVISRAQYVCLAKTPSEGAGKRDASRMTAIESRVGR